MTTQAEAAAEYQRLQAEHARYDVQADADAEQAAALKPWAQTHPNAQPLPRVLIWCLLIALGCGLAFFLAGLVVGSWTLTVFGAVLVALVMAGAIKAGE